MQTNKTFLYTHLHTLPYANTPTHKDNNTHTHSMTNTDANTDAGSALISKHRQSAT